MHADKKANNKQLEQAVLILIQQFSEMLGNLPNAERLSVQMGLSRDLGLGSLERAELNLQLRAKLGYQVPTQKLYQVETIEELIHSLEKVAHIKLPKTTTLTPRAPSITFPETSKNLIEVLKFHATQTPNFPHIILQSETGEESVLTFDDLWQASLKTATGLLKNGMQRQDKVAILLPTDKTFFYAFFGTLLAGGTPVPLYPPLRLSQLAEYVNREISILNSAQARFLITDQLTQRVGKLIAPLMPTPFTTIEESSLLAYPIEKLGYFPEPCHLALIQYTSGSTGNPKGVALSHQNILTNIRTLGTALNIQLTDTIISWLPLYHDMGLIGAWLGSLYFGIPLVLMSPLTFLSQPERWLWAIHQHQGTLTAAPNFAYELCAKKISDDKLTGLNLSSLRVSLSGAESVNPNTLRRYIERFKPYGFNPKAFFPAYGLAESTVGLCFPPLERAPRIDRIDRHIFETTRYAQPANPHDHTPLEFVSCGFPIPNHHVRILDDNHLVAPTRTEGRLQFSGPSTMQGYFNAPEATSAVFDGEWCDSGDLAYEADGEIFITGRIKDLIIKAGRNLHPEEIEALTSEIKGVRKGCVITFGVQDPIQGTEKVVIVAETVYKKPEDQSSLKQLIRDKLSNSIGLTPDEVILVKPYVLPKTSSGKLRRSSCQKLYLENKLTASHKSLLIQWSKIKFSAIFPNIKHLLSFLTIQSYSAYVYAMFFLTLIPTWLIMLCLPAGKPLTRSVSKYWTKLFLHVTGLYPTISGLHHLPKKPAILVANHASYIDAIVLSASLPIDFLFVGKAELLNDIFIGTFLKKQGHITVDKNLLEQGEWETHLISETLIKGQSILIFPEGTFTRITGIRPLRLGAFKAAADSQCPIVPITLRGTRFVYKDEQWTVRHGPIKVTISTPIQAPDNHFESIVQLREKIRGIFCKNSKEPLLR